MTSGRLRKGPVLVVGAADLSLGKAIAQACNDIGHTVYTAGLYGGGEDLVADIRNPLRCETLINETKPTYVVCTAGVNRPAKFGSLDENMRTWLWGSMESNVMGPMYLLRAFSALLPSYHKSRDQSEYRPHFVAISSNSARIARRSSMAYCASKAALSMAIRCAARELTGDPCLVYGYEPGLLKDTPMTMRLAERFGEHPTRMPGAPDGVAVPYTADVIARNLRTGGVALNGCLIPLDAGEQ